MIYSVICMWNSFKAEVNTFQEKKKIIVSKQALTTEVYLFPNTQEFANMTPIKANETHTYESVCLKKKGRQTHILHKCLSWCWMINPPSAFIYS